jgi:hypothetical protein
VTGGTRLCSSLPCSCALHLAQKEGQELPTSRTVIKAVTRIYDGGAPFLGEGCYFHPDNLTKTHCKPLSEVVERLRKREASYISAGFITKAPYAK